MNTMNKDKTNEKTAIQDKNIIFYTKFNHMQIENYTRKEKTPRELLSDIGADELSSWFEMIDSKMDYLVSRILTFETISIECKGYLEQLSSYYNACKYVLQGISKKERIPMKHFFCYTNISDVERLLTAYKLLLIQDEAKKEKLLAEYKLLSIQEEAKKKRILTEYRLLSIQKEAMKKSYRK